jgi:hypothetical protein
VAAHNTERPRANEENLSDLFQNTPGFKVRPAAIMDEDLEKLSWQDPQIEMLRWHYRLGNLSFRRIKCMAELGILPKKLAQVTPPKCAGCLFGTMTKKPWRNKGKIPKGVGHLATAPGQMVSVDQLESSAAGLISQLKGKLTRRRYKAATIFVDNFSRISYVHLQESLTSADIVEAKEAFEAFTRNMGVRIQHYHADNGRFADNGFMNDVKQHQQTISFCGVNAHFQNGIAKKRIRDLQEQSRTMLLYVKSRWPKGVSINLWPYALRSANQLRQVTPDKEDGTSPLEIFSGAEVAANLKDCHTPLYPVYALNSSLANGKSIPKWDNRCRLGINLGPSTRHARNMSLVLNLTTGLSSP